MRKSIILIGICLAAVSTLMAQSVLVYRNDDPSTFAFYEAVTRMQSSNVSDQGELQPIYVSQEIETADTLYRIPLHAIDSIRFQAPIPESFPMKHLIEEFTGQGCGYCPYGMDCISEFMKADPENWVLILHHYGYQADHFSVAGSKTITTTLGVDGAPSVSIDRAKTNHGDGKTIVFHPGYLPEDVAKSQFATTTYASVQIDNTYDPETRELKVHVSGAISKKDYPTLQLTVLVKESGMVDTQQDYYFTYEGWEQFRHSNAVRVFLSAAKGDVLSIDPSRHYEATYTTTLKEAWVPENCMVVAFLSEAFKPVVQAEQSPVVAGTAGGADIAHGGIKAVEVPDYYPEPGADKNPKSYTGNDVEKLSSSTAYYQSYPKQNIKLWQLQAYSTTTVTIGGTKCIPFAWIYLYTTNEVSSIPQGEYPINTTEQAGTVYAGFRDDSQVLIDGSQFYLTSYSYFQQGYLAPSAEWLISDGTLTVDKDGKWSLDGHARNGMELHLQGTTAIQNGGSSSAPARKMPKQ